ncbi:MAG: hypothetical protein J0J15_12495, partial [Mesorhizobium sp.]|nr:hypothetical protein [Mesorhizobium sp.]
LGRRKDAGGKLDAQLLDFVVDGKHVSLLCLKTRDVHDDGAVRAEDRRRRPAEPASGGAKMRSILGVPLVLEAG